VFRCHEAGSAINDFETKMISMPIAARERNDVVAQVVEEIEKSEIKDELQQNVVAAIR
tara:strand:- start:140 stop:313 length:174 start_codon:yes stop_codon:yes gene_type:complete